MTRLGRVTALVLLCGWGLGCSREIAYRFVDTLSEAGPSLAVPLLAEDGLVRALDTGSIEPAVRRLAAPEMEGRGRGTVGNARARSSVWLSRRPTLPD